MSKEPRLYDAKFYRELDSTRDSAREILPMVVGLLRPASIVDIGCGTGHWLATAIEMGISDVLGVDGDWVTQAKLAIPQEKFLVHNLGTPLKLNRRFDLATSLEVAEHLPASEARAFIELLCDCADTVLFSAAIPGQGGRHHMNEQWPVYWADLFAGFGFHCYDPLRPTLWQNPRVLWYYAQNCMIYARAGSPIQASPVAKPLALIHPVLWSKQLERLNSPGKLLERLPKAFLSVLRGRHD
jgi:SAM-dependent methyltransferase